MLDLNFGASMWRQRYACELAVWYDNCRMRALVYFNFDMLKLCISLSDSTAIDALSEESKESFIFVIIPQCKLIVVSRLGSVGQHLTLPCCYTSGCIRELHRRMVLNIVTACPEYPVSSNGGVHVLCDMIKEHVHQNIRQWCLAAPLRRARSFESYGLYLFYLKDERYEHDVIHSILLLAIEPTLGRKCAWASDSLWSLMPIRSLEYAVFEILCAILYQSNCA